MKRIACALFFFTLLLYNGNASASALSAVVVEAESGRVLYASNADAQLPMASTTKIMTALVVLENCALQEVVTVSSNAFGVPGTSVYLEAGEKLTVEQLLYGLMLASGNDAAVALAEHVSGSVDAFCGLMNARAAEIGCEHTHFVTPHGLPAAQHYTTAYELALIAREAMKSDDFRTIVSTQRATIPWESRGYDRILNNKNRLLSRFDGALGIKTGYTKAAGRCLVSAAERNGMTLIGVVLNCPDWFDVSAQLLDDAYAHYEMKRAFSAGDVIASIDVENGTQKQVLAVAQSDVCIPMRKDEEPNVVITLPKSLPAGFRAGDIIGVIELLLDNETLCSVPIVTQSAVAERTFLTKLNRTMADWLLISN